MKKSTFKFLPLFAALLIICASVSGCVVQDQTTEQLPKLPTPEVVIGVDGMAVWNEVAGAQYYIYILDGGEEQPTFGTHVQLEENQTIKVKAVTARTGYADSDYSQLQTYVKTILPDDHSHVDLNSDGICDKCLQSVMAELSFYAVNDLHGKFIDAGNQPGVDEFTTFLKNLYLDPSREEILLSSGDMWQGTVESSTNKGKLMTEWMNDVGFVSMTLGNHEYDWGDGALLSNSTVADFPFLGVNVTSYGLPAGYCRPSAVVEKSGVKIGIIGAIGDCLGSISGDVKSGLAFATGDELTALVKAESERLRREEGCEFIVYSLHDGGSGFSSGINSVKNSEMSWYDSSLSDGYVDLVFEGHTHNRYILQDEYNVYHMQGGGENSYISSAQVSFNRVTKEFKVTPRIIGTSEYANSSLADDPVVQNLYKEYFPDSDPYNTVLGSNRFKRDSTDICDTVAQLYYEKGKQLWGDKYDIVLGGGYLSTRNPYDLNSGEVTYADLFSILPFDNQLVLGAISGYYLKSQFINSTNSSYHIYPSVSASEIRDNVTYFIVVDSYTSTYRYNHITEKERLNEEIYSRDLLADFISSGGWASYKSVINAINGTFSGVPQSVFAQFNGGLCL